LGYASAPVLPSHNHPICHTPYATTRATPYRE
jgi:hypothetical protein